MKRTYFCNRHLALCALLWTQSLIGQTTGRHETANDLRESSARPSEVARPGVPGRVKQEELELMRILTMINWPEWNDAQLDSAVEVWLQWWVGGERN